MEDEIVLEDEWQEIESPFLIADWSEFPPLDHDQVNLEALDSLSSLSGLEMSSSDEGEEAEEERRLTQRLGAVGLEIIQAACRVKNHLLSSITGLKTTKILISTAASGTLVLVLVSLFYMKMQRRQRKAQLETTHKFIKEKDQRISQLLLQISQMNELLQARRKVPVIRVG